jgi:hypothetical protein
MHTYKLPGQSISGKWKHLRTLREISFLTGKNQETSHRKVIFELGFES